MNKQELQGLLEFANEHQREAIETSLLFDSYEEAASALDMTSSGLRSLITRVRKRAATKGYAPEYDYVRQVPDPYIVKGVSTYYNKDGERAGQWVKSAISLKEYEEQLSEIASLFFKDLPEIKTPEFTVDNYDTDIIPWFNIGDAHLGMLSHSDEVGSNFDINIAASELMGAFNILFSECNYGERCVINDLGDFTHYENFGGVTDHSGHSLDYDTRFHKMIQFYIPLMRFIIESALKKFKYVDVIINQGNHSRTNDIWMAHLLKSVYKSTDRITIIDNSNVFIPYKMGNTFIMTHHSDKCKPKKLAEVMATDYAEQWGDSEYRYIFIGHIHHSMILKEHAGVTVESFNNLATRDKYAHDGGWRSRQSITRVDLSRKYGEVGRRTLPLQLIRDTIQSGMIKAVKGYKLKPKKKVYTV